MLTEPRKNQDVRLWLKGYRSNMRNLDNHIKTYERYRAKVDRYETAFSRATKCTQTWGAKLTGKQRNFTNSTADAVLEMIEASAAAARGEYDGFFDWLVDDLSALASSGREVLAAINSLSNADHKDTLFRRYIAGDAWEKISLDMCVSLDTVYKWHGHALEELKQKGVYQHSEHPEPKTVH